MPPRTWGFSASEWSSMRAALHALLAEVASKRSTVTYGEIARRVFGGRVSARSGALMDLLGEVDDESEANSGVMLASLVVRADSGIPGEGYFVYAAEHLGRRIENREEFWRDEVERVWALFAEETVVGP